MRTKSTTSSSDSTRVTNGGDRNRNALVWPYIAINKDEFRTVQVGLAGFSNLEGSNVPVVLAATTLVIAPVLVVYAFAQKWFIESAASSGLKG